MSTPPCAVTVNILFRTIQQMFQQTFLRLVNQIFHHLKYSAEFDLYAHQSMVMLVIALGLLSVCQSIT